MSKEFLVAEYQRSLQGEIAFDCREGQCQTCGILDTFPRDAEAMRQAGWGCVGVLQDAVQAGAAKRSQR